MAVMEDKQDTEKVDAYYSRWITLRRHLKRHQTLNTIEKNVTQDGKILIKDEYVDYDYICTNTTTYIVHIMKDSEVVRRISLQPDDKRMQAVEEFMNEVMYAYKLTEINNANRSESVKKLKGIIKKRLSNEERCRSQAPKNRVHFSDENIYILIPRPPKSIFTVVTDKCCYYCCFGYLFPK